MEHRKTDDGAKAVAYEAWVTRNARVARRPIGPLELIADSVSEREELVSIAAFLDAAREVCSDPSKRLELASKFKTKLAAFGPKEFKPTVEQIAERIKESRPMLALLSAMCVAEPTTMGSIINRGKLLHVARADSLLETLNKGCGYLEAAETEGWANVVGANGERLEAGRCLVSADGADAANADGFLVYSSKLRLHGSDEERLEWLKETALLAQACSVDSAMLANGGGIGDDRAPAHVVLVTEGTARHDGYVLFRMMAIPSAAALEHLVWIASGASRASDVGRVGLRQSQYGYTLGSLAAAGFERFIHNVESGVVMFVQTKPTDPVDLIEQIGLVALNVDACLEEYATGLL